jgi:hypothetical protein
VIVSWGLSSWLWLLVVIVISYWLWLFHLLSTENDEQSLCFTLFFLPILLLEFWVKLFVLPNTIYVLSEAIHANWRFNRSKSFFFFLNSIKIFQFNFFSNKIISVKQAYWSNWLLFWYHYYEASQIYFFYFFYFLIKKFPNHYSASFFEWMLNFKFSFDSLIFPINLINSFDLLNFHTNNQFLSKVPIFINFHKE